MIGTTAALIGMAIASGASEVAKAKIASNASKKAAGVQQASGAQALNLATDIWGQQQQNMAPFVQTGTNANNLLGSLMTPQGMPGAYHPGITFPQPQRSGPIPTTGVSRLPQIWNPNGNNTGTAVPTGGGLGGFMMPRRPSTPNILY